MNLLGALSAVCFSPSKTSLPSVSVKHLPYRPHVDFDLTPLHSVESLLLLDSSAGHLDTAVIYGTRVRPPLFLFLVAFNVKPSG